MVSVPLPPPGDKLLSDLAASADLNPMQLLGLLEAVSEIGGFMGWLRRVPLEGLISVRDTLVRLGGHDHIVRELDLLIRWKRELTDATP